MTNNVHAYRESPALEHSKFLFSSNLLTRRKRFAREDESLVIKEGDCSEDDLDSPESPLHVRPSKQKLISQSHLGSPLDKIPRSVSGQKKFKESLQELLVVSDKQPSEGIALLKSQSEIGKRQFSSKVIEIQSCLGSSDSSISEGDIKDLAIEQQKVFPQNYMAAQFNDSFTTESDSSLSSSEIEEKLFSDLESDKAKNRSPSIHSFLIIKEPRMGIEIKGRSPSLRSAQAQKVKNLDSFTQPSQNPKKTLLRHHSWLDLGNKLTRKNLDEKCHKCVASLYNN